MVRILETKKKIRIERAIAQTKEFYKVKNDVLPHHQRLFYDNINQHVEMEKSSLNLQQWLNTWAPVLHNSLKNAKKLGLQ